MGQRYSTERAAGGRRYADDLLGDDCSQNLAHAKFFCHLLSRSVTIHRAPALRAARMRKN
jgi:hypothetical protein